MKNPSSTSVPPALNLYQLHRGPEMGYTSEIRAILLFGMLMPIACSRSNDDCTCLVENGGERRTLACGESSCVAGLLLACIDEQSSVSRGSCTETPVTPPPPSTFDSGSTQPPDTRCDDLRTFCSTSCSRPATVAADCQTTASIGNPDSCASWPLANGFLCKP